MKPTLAPGAAHTRSLVVDRARTIEFMGEELRVYATPEMIRDIEITCRELLLPHCEAGEDSVGTRIEVSHVAPALLGTQVEISVTVIDVKGRSVTFETSVRDMIEEIGSGRHKRFVTDKGKTAERLTAKAAKLKGL
jgi:fluoroacetyl-CoA thioesterase